MSARWSSHHKKDLTPLPHRRAMPPEMLVADDERQAKLLKAFVDAAKEQWANPSDRTIFPPTHVC